MDTQRLPKKEEEEEEDHLLSSTFESINGHSRDQHNHSIDDFESIFDITIDNLSCSNELTWDFWEEDEDEDVGEEEKRSSTDQEGSSFGFWENKPTDYEDKDLGLKLNLNHQEVIDAWSDHQKPLWTDTSTLDNSVYVSFYESLSCCAKGRSASDRGEEKHAKRSKCVKVQREKTE
ncbi:Contains similarity to a putative protein F18O22.160 gi/7573462 from Arabidopsis thaliana BAC F18O22 gb/AL163817 [Arabidopsis thaliana]|uniref:F10K1.24 protein n=1 Tax=Arabidopsis thaliana TaxID=3702 RepID=Q9LMJ8_ARATH|nr:Contains similarity to a putative protein F18O22.160 gi/7573462 from Arabidopsis thaliana BAC F18O22 gb/AL163817 [Arabidopsis thaliana]